MHNVQCFTILDQSIYCGGKFEKPSDEKDQLKSLCFSHCKDRKKPFAVKSCGSDCQVRVYY